MRRSAPDVAPVGAFKAPVRILSSRRAALIYHHAGAGRSGPERYPENDMSMNSPGPETPPKAAADDFEGRFREIMADPSNAYIPRVADRRHRAGRYRRHAHTGLRVHAKLLR